MGVKYTSEIQNDDGWSDWIVPVDLKNYPLACCDCGLVHTMQFQVIIGKHLPGGMVESEDLTRRLLKVRLKNGERIMIRLRAARNERSTGQMRRWMKKKLKGIFGL